MNNQNKIPDFLKVKEKTIDQIVRFSSTESLNFFKESFHKHGFTDTAFTPWQKHTDPNYRAGGALLVQTGNLRDSLQILSRSRLRMVFGTNTPYAKIHNEGGVINIPITKRSRGYFWYMYKVTGQEHWKWMALTKKTQLTVKMPKRQFIQMYFLLIFNLFTKIPIRKLEFKLS